MTSTWFRLRARHCQLCCNSISSWAAFFGVLNCHSCVQQLKMGRTPRCSNTSGGLHPHGEEIR